MESRAVDTDSRCALVSGVFAVGGVLGICACFSRQPCMGEPPRGVFAWGRVVGGKGFLVEARAQSRRLDSLMR
jgi:hypothetical protein